MTQPAAASKNAYGDRIYRVPDPNTGEICDLVSMSVLLNQMSKPGVDRWKLGNVARDVSRRPDLQMLAASGHEYDVVRQVEDGNRVKSNAGTAVHSVTEHDEEGVLDDETVAHAARPFLAQYRMLRERVGWQMVAQEFSVVNFAIGYAGSADLAALMPANRFVPQPHVAILDKKTGSGVHWETAVQLAGYANGEYIWQAPTELPETERLTAELEHNIATGENVPEGRRKWSQEATKEARTAIAAVKDDERSKLGKFVPLPEGLRTDIAYVIHWLYEDDVPVDAELVALHLGGGKAGWAYSEVVHLKGHYEVVSGPAKGAVGPRIDRDDPALAVGGLIEQAAAAIVNEDNPAPSVLPGKPLAITQQYDKAGAVLSTVSVSREILQDPGPTPMQLAANAHQDDAGTFAVAATAEAIAEAVKVSSTPERTPAIYREWLATRLGVWNGRLRTQLAERWPKGVPTFKSDEPITDAQLDLLRTVMDDIANAAGLVDEPNAADYFIPPVGTPEAVALVMSTFPGTEETIPLEGRQVMIRRLTELRDAHPEILDPLKTRLAEHRLLKNLRTDDTWTGRELADFGRVLDTIEREHRL